MTTGTGAWRTQYSATDPSTCGLALLGLPLPTTTISARSARDASTRPA